MSPVIQSLINQFKLQPHPEGGFYAQTHKSQTQVRKLDHTGDQRAAQTSIYFLMTKEGFSAFHRLTSEEIWCFHQGQPIRVISLNSQTKEASVEILGSPVTHQDAKLQVIIPPNTWFAAEIISSDNPDLRDSDSKNDKSAEDDYALVTCIVSPGFEFSDFKLANSEQLQKEFPGAAGDIHRLTRELPNHEVDQSIIYEDELAEQRIGPKCC